MSQYVHHTTISSKSPHDPHISSYLKPNLPLPDTLDLRPYLPPVRDQGNRGTCSAFAVSSCKEYEERVTDYFSPEFIYFYRSGKPTGSTMSGLEALKILYNTGIVPDYQYPYLSRDNLAQKPDIFLLTSASEHLSSGFAEVTTIHETKMALNQFGLCYIAFPVYSTRPHFWRRSGPQEPSNGGHALTIVGYTSDSFILRNSWGATWNGDGHIHYPFSDWPSHWEIYCLL